MALLTISEASKQFKIARSYLYKKINNGELSTQLNDQGVKVVQYIDLVRVFGENNINAENSPQPVHEDKRGQDLRTKEDDKKTSEDIVNLLKDQVSELKKDKEDMARRLDDMSSKHDKLLLLIEHKAFSSSEKLGTIEDNSQPVHEDNRGQDLRTKEDDKKTSSILLFIGILIIILLIGLISIFGLKFSGLI